MGWSLGFDDKWQRDIGYGVPAICDKPKCGKEIDRGLSHVCGGLPYGGETGCGLYFCVEHLDHRGWCARCHSYNKKPYPPTPDHLTWINHKLTDASWRQWRTENPDAVDRLKEEYCRRGGVLVCVPYKTKLFLRCHVVGCVKRATHAVYTRQHDEVGKFCTAHATAWLHLTEKG